MSKKNEESINLLGDQIFASLTDQIDSAIINMMKTIRTNINQTNKKFFKILTNKIVNKKKSPSFEGVKPINWAPLTELYTSRRYKQHKIRSDVFYKSGRTKGTPLSVSLPSLNYETIFGVPTLTYKLGSTAHGDRAEVRYIQRRAGFQKVIYGKKGTRISQRTKLPKSLSAFVELTPFPVLTGEFATSVLAGGDDMAVETFIFEHETGQNISAKLTNPGPGRGKIGAASGRKRLVLRAYMEYWLKVEMRSAMRRGVI